MLIRARAAVSLFALAMLPLLAHSGPLDDVPRMVYLAGPHSPFPCKLPGVAVSDLPFPINKPYPPKPGEPGAPFADWATWWYVAAAMALSTQNDAHIFSLAQCGQSIGPMGDRDLLAAFIAAQLKAGKSGASLITEAKLQLAALKAATAAPSGSSTFP